jgi:predicted RNase H-like nuclease
MIEQVGSMRLICGADGCKAGWIAIFRDLDTEAVSWRLCNTAHELMYGEPAPQVIAIDIPIGLPDRGSRPCDQQARRLLGPGRGSSVFPAPIRPVLAATSYMEACQIGLQVEGKKLSRQAWAICYKIRDVDQLIHQDPGLKARVSEVHPEVSFYFLAGNRPLQHNKKRKEGRTERQKLLEDVFGEQLHDVLAQCRERKKVGEDDILDAFVALWTAERITSGKAQTIPPVPPEDSFGLPMQIVA